MAEADAGVPSSSGPTRCQGRSVSVDASRTSRLMSPSTLLSVSLPTYISSTAASPSTGCLKALPLFKK